VGGGVRGGAEAERLTGGAQRSGVGRKGREDRYPAHAANWLRDRRWEDPPPQGAVIDQDGNIVAVEQPPPPKKRTGYTALADQLIEEMERGEWGGLDWGWGPVQ